MYSASFTYLSNNKLVKVILLVLFFQVLVVLVSLLVMELLFSLIDVVLIGIHVVKVSLLVGLTPLFEVVVAGPSSLIILLEEDVSLIVRNRAFEMFVIQHSCIVPDILEL